MTLASIQEKQKRLIEGAIQKKVRLLQDTEEKRDVASSPIEREKHELEIKDLKSFIDQYKADLRLLETEIKIESQTSKSLSFESYRVRFDDSLSEQQLNSEFAREVRDLLSLMDYELEDEFLQGIGLSTPPIFVARQEGDFKALKTLFGCLFGIVDENQVISFSNIYSLNYQQRELNFAVLVTNTYVAPEAKLHAQQLKIQLLSFEDLLNTVIRVDRYLKGKCRDYEQSNQLFHTYVEIKYLRRGAGRFANNQAHHQEFAVMETSDGSSFEAKGDLTPYADAWLFRDGNSQICLLGEYGTGKTSFVTQYFYKRALAYIENPVRNRIPLFITLNRYNKSADIEQLMTSFLVNECGVRRDFKTFLKLAERGKLLIILDGFDEMAKQVDLNIRRYNFKQISKLVIGRNKVILSGRPNYFLTQAEINEIFGEEVEGRDPYQAALSKATAHSRPKYEILNTTLFDRWQIEEFLKRQSTYLREKGIADWRELSKTIYETYNLEELARTPVLLEIIIKTLSEIRGKVADINAAKLYQIYTNFWMDREYDEKGEVRWLITRKEKELFVSELAWTMLISDNLHPEIHFSQLSERVRTYFNLEKASEIEYFSSDIRFCSYLIHSASDGNYKFIHKSFMEYFSALYIYNATFRERNVCNIITDRPITDEVFFFLSQMLGLDEIDSLWKLSIDERDKTCKQFLISLTARVLKQLVQVSEHKGALQVAEEWAKRLLQYSDTIGSDESRIWGLIALGNLKTELSQYADANECYQQALDISIRLGDKTIESQALSQMGRIHQIRGEYEEALRNYTQAIMIFEKLGYIGRAGEAIAQVGAIHRDRGDYDAALRHYSNAMKSFEVVGNAASTGQALLSIGTLHENLARYESSLECFQRALGVFRELGDKRNESKAIARLGRTYRVLGRYEEAEVFFNEELKISEELGDLKGMSKAHSNVGDLWMSKLHYSEAEAAYQRALATSETLQDRQGISSALSALGNVYQEMARFGDAEFSYRKAIEILNELGDRSNLASSFYQLANVYANQDQNTEARRYYERSLEIFEELGDKFRTSKVIHRLGIAAQDSKDFEHAEQYLLRSLEIKEQIADVAGVQELLESLGGLEEARQRPTEAKKLYLSALETSEKIGLRGATCRLYEKLGKLSKRIGLEHEAVQYYELHMKLAREMKLPVDKATVREYEQLKPLTEHNPFVVGVPIQSSVSFVGRQKELGALYRAIQDGNSVMLVGDRRMGKTSLLYQLRSQLTLPTVHVFIDLEAFPSHAEGMLDGILRKLISELHSHKLLSSDRRDVFPITYASDFQAALESILDDAKERLKDLRVVLILDEAERLFATDGQVARVLRSVLTANQDVLAVISGTRWLLEISSKTLESPLQNIFTVIVLPPLSKELTESLIEELSLQVGVEFTSSALERIYELSGGIPFYCQIVGFELIELARRESKRKITLKEVDTVISETLSSFQFNFEYTWKDLSELEQAVITEIIGDDPRVGLNEETVKSLQTRQLIEEKNGKYRVVPGLFEAWLKSYKTTNP